MRNRACWLVAMVLASGLTGAAVGVLASSRPSANPDPFPGVMYAGKPYACAQVAYGTYGTDFYHCTPG